MKLVGNDIKKEFKDEIFNSLYSDDNTMLGKLSNSDRVYILYLLKQYYLELRKKIDISDNITFGLELEFDSMFSDIIDENLYNIVGDDWCVVPEGSIINGGEINSPILTDTEKNWKDLMTVCSILGKYASSTESTGAHVHLGIQILGNNPKYWRNFALLWSTYENIIFRFLYGEYVSPRSRINDYATPVSKDYITNLDRIEDRANYINANYMFKLFDSGNQNIKLRRRKSVNFTNVSDLPPYVYDRIIKMNTVEFRSPNGTFNPVIWQNNVNLLVKLMLYCKSDKFNEEIIKRRMNKIIEDNILSNLYKYSFINYDQAIEFADLIFDNNLDKIYFLRQYIKDGTLSNKLFIRSECFTRR